MTGWKHETEVIHTEQRSKLPREMKRETPIKLKRGID